MSTREGQMWIYLRPHLLRAGLLVERLTDRLADARPDVLWLDTYDGLTGLCELKAPAPKAKTLGMRPGQAYWLWRWARGQGWASILARWPDGGWSLYAPGPLVSWVRAIEGPVSAAAPHVALSWYWREFPGGEEIRKTLRLSRRLQAVSNG